MDKRLFRSRTDRMLWGVCGGLAHYFAIDPVIVRLIFILTIFFGGFGIMAYIILAIVVPVESSQASEPRETIKENVQEMKETAQSLGKEIHATLSGKEQEKESDSHNRTITIVGFVIIIAGIIFLLSSIFSWFHWWSWAFVWPVILITIGLLIIFSRRK